MKTASPKKKPTTPSTHQLSQRPQHASTTTPAKGKGAGRKKGQRSQPNPPMASSLSLALFLLCILLPAPPLAAALLFGGGKSAGKAAAGLDMEWRPATATWYGDAEGDGSDGGACGYGTLVDVVPMKARVGSVSPVLFKDGEGCGACYKVKCLDRGICSRRAVTVIVTDECPGGLCAGGHTHFDLSGTAFSRMAVAGAGGRLRDRGQLNVVYRRTACKYGGKNIAFRVNEGSTNFWLSLLVEFEDGEGDIGSMQIKQANSVDWLDMKHVWGAEWCLVRGPLVGPFSVRLATLSAKKTLTARDVIPRNWTPKGTYTSRLNFEPSL